MVKELIDLYTRKIELAQTFPGDEKALFASDPVDIPSSNYCKRFTYCNDCKLFAENGECCGGLWIDLFFAKTWKEWLPLAHKLLAFIKKYG